ncbi:hypothetical protein [Streptosporangium subroseum]|uniref:hypothetical protein n=1 Tax=Streptosporangium subroseum TaxID=106412 RepID=UPI00117C4685|nr:hypothetical protein [Streptosporangium subroseum]
MSNQAETVSPPTITDDRTIQGNDHGPAPAASAVTRVANAAGHSSPDRRGLREPRHQASTPVHVSGSRMAGQARTPGSPQVENLRERAAAIR